MIGALILGILWVAVLSLIYVGHRMIDPYRGGEEDDA